MKTLLYYIAPEIRALVDLSTSYRSKLQPTIETAHIAQIICAKEHLISVSIHPNLKDIFEEPEI
jgi:hypothetical protein